MDDLPKSGEGFPNYDAVRNDKILNCLKILSEHFDTVQIFATWHNPQTNVTINFEHGIGNAYARRAQASIWAQATMGAEVMHRSSQILRDTQGGDDALPKE